MIIYLTRGQRYATILSVASQNKQFNHSARRNRPAARRGLSPLAVRLLLARPRNQATRPMSYLADAFVALYCLRFPA